MPGVQRVQHVSVPMPPGRHAEARAFYGGALGMEEMPVPASLVAAGFDVVWFHAGPDGHEVHVFVDRQGAEPVRAQHLCLQVDDIEAMAEHLAAHGVAVEDAPPIPGRPRCFVRDPFGNLIEFTEILGDYR